MTVTLAVCLCMVCAIPVVFVVGFMVGKAWRMGDLKLAREGQAFYANQWLARHRDYVGKVCELETLRAENARLQDELAGPALTTQYIPEPSREPRGDDAS
jgi:hypothetical protein